jgi:hypothetical protein
MSRAARRTSQARPVIHNKDGAVYRNGGNVAGKIQQSGRNRAVIPHAGRRSGYWSSVMAALIVFAGIASVVVAFAIGVWFDADWATRDS